MLLCAIIRCVVIRLSHVAFDLPLPYWWLYAEACIAVIMGSLTVYRSALVGSHDIIGNFQGYIKRRRGKSSTGQVTAETGRASGKKAPLQSLKLPGATISGIRTVFGLGTNTQARNMSDICSVADSADTDYHAHLKEAINHPA